MTPTLTPDLRAIEQGLTAEDLQGLAYQAGERLRFEALLASEQAERRRVLRENYRQTRRSLDTGHPFGGGN